MADPLEIKLTLRRRVLLDVQGRNWRVAFYRPNLPPHTLARLSQQADAGKKAAQEELARAPERRSSAKAPTLADALRKAAPTEISLAEAKQVADYVLSFRYAERAS